MSGISGWHPGEKSIQRKLGFESAVSYYYSAIEGSMPGDHRYFYTSRLPFIPITTLDAEGRPWTSIAAGPSGEKGFASSTYYNQLVLNTRLIRGDPIEDNVKLLGTVDKMLIAGIGVDFSTRQRTKFAGIVTNVFQKGDNLGIELEVNQALGNCPKYINHRDLIPHPDINPEVVYKNLHMSKSDRLPEEVIKFVHESDTVFLGTSYKAKPQNEKRFPSHVGQNQRGGKPGFVRVSPSNGRTVVLPDYSGNRLMTSLGNIESTPLASLSFASFTEGHILYLTGRAQTLLGEDAQAVMPRQNVITTLDVTGYVFIRDALTVRQRPGTEVGRSPYSPPIKYLADELHDTSSSFFNEQVRVTLANIEVHSQDLATFTFNSSKPLQIKPGQTAVLDFTDVLGKTEYSHMAPWNPSSINDDRIRTWTVSRADAPNQFSLTMREKRGGAVTGALFSIARKLASNRPDLLANSLPLDLTLRLVGIAGDFTLDYTNGNSATTSGTITTTTTPPPPKPQLWLAGGIGVTPFLSMLTAITSAPPTDANTTDDVGISTGPWDVSLIVSTREPDVLVDLILRHIKPNGHTRVRLTVDVFSHQYFDLPRKKEVPIAEGLEVVFRKHKKRVDASFLAEIPRLKERTTYMCGPPEFEKNMLNSLEDQGVDGSVVRREGFEY